MREWVLGHTPSLTAPHQVPWPLIISEPLMEVWASEANRIAHAWSEATIALWTSREAVRFWEMWRLDMATPAALLPWDREGIMHWCVGRGTARRVSEVGAKQVRIAQIATAEGLLHDLLQQPLQHMKILWLHAAGARPILRDGLGSKVTSWTDLVFYETRPRWEQMRPPYELDDQLLFTSPSCVHAWESREWPWPPVAQVRAIGTITADLLERKLGCRPKLAIDK